MYDTQCKRLGHICQKQEHIGASGVFWLVFLGMAEPFQGMPTGTRAGLPPSEGAHGAPSDGRHGAPSDGRHGAARRGAMPLWARLWKKADNRGCGGVRNPPKSSRFRKKKPALRAGFVLNDPD